LDKAAEIDEEPEEEALERRRFFSEGAIST
jgi:hypothetical protein